MKSGAIHINGKPVPSTTTLVKNGDVISHTLTAMNLQSQASPSRSSTKTKA